MTQPKGRGGLGFRDLHAFNLAMIAKQGWHIMTQPNTLVAKLYKARYFPNSSFFESKIGHNPSYAWRGIWKARNVLMNGCRWSVGNGDSIKVMNDPWLRGTDGAWIPSPQDQGAYNLMVKDLMLPHVKVWDKKKIESIFPLHIAQCILDIPLFDLLEEDKLVWVDSVHGHYSVKSGYKLLMNVIGQKTEAYRQDHWQSLWKIHAPPKAKHLLWRICKGCLPTRNRLQGRGVSCPLTCPLCDHENEDDWHAIFSCEINVLARQAAGIGHALAQLLQQQGNATSAILDLCANTDANVAGLFAMLVWVLWKNRNNRVWNNASDSGRSLGITAKRLWEEWDSVQQIQHSVQPEQQVQQLQTWQKPEYGWLKCNVDAAFHATLNKTSVGWCVRDYMGRFVMAGTSWKDGKCSVTEGESIALLESIKAMVYRGISQVILETDSKSVVDAIQQSSLGSSQFSTIISQLQNVLSNNPNFMVKFIKRQANMVPHTLARAAISWARRYVFDSLPLCITPLLNNEMT